MMVTWVRGLFKDIHGQVEIDFDNPLASTFVGQIDATRVWTGEPTRDAHLRSADFLDVGNHPLIAFEGRCTERVGHSNFRATADLTIRGITRPVALDVAYLGLWESPFWVGDENKGTMRRIGFEARTTINRHDFGVSWQDHLPRDGVVVSNHVEIVVDVEGIHLGDLEATGAIRYYRRDDPVVDEKTGSPAAADD
jgi:polyisoprenoid-binding protein YceI